MQTYLRSDASSKIREFDVDKCNIQLNVNKLRKITLQYIRDLNAGKQTEVNDRGTTIEHEGNLERFK